MAALFIENLTVMDFSFAHAERGLLGESWIVDVTLFGELNEQGMVFDFGDVKKQIKQAIDHLYDHRLLIPNQLPAFQAMRLDDQLEINWRDRQARCYSHCSPASAVVMLPVAAITPDTVAPLITQELERLLPANVEKITVTLRPEASEGVYYHYSHGLKKHRGNCQRIAHGHRSRIEIRVNGQRDPAREADWARRWRDIYIGTRADLAQDFAREGHAYYHFAYGAQQGHFGLTLPQSACYLIDQDSTVEQLADHIAHTLKTEQPDDRIQVKAFEGVMKGALAAR